jgi:hypothetical protein
MTSAPPSCPELTAFLATNFPQANIRLNHDAGESLSMPNRAAGICLGGARTPRA